MVGGPAQRAHARPPVQVVALLAGGRCGVERRGAGQQRHAPGRALDVGGRPRLAEVTAYAGECQTRPLQVSQSGHQPPLAVIEAVVVGARHHRYTRPLQVVEQVRVGSRPDAARRRGRRRLEAVNLHLQVGERGVRASQQLDQRQKVGLSERRERPRNHAVARGRDHYLASLGLVHVGPPLPLVSGSAAGAPSARANAPTRQRANARNHTIWARAKPSERSTSFHGERPSAHGGATATACPRPVPALS